MIHNWLEDHPEWFSSNEGVVTVSSDGIVRAISEGGASITGRFTGYHVSLSDSIRFDISR